MALDGTGKLNTLNTAVGARWYLGTIMAPVTKFSVLNLVTQ